LTKKYTLLDRDQDLRAYVDSLSGAEKQEIALDIEGEFNLHRYGEHLCLVQIFDGDRAVVIDPLKTDIQPLRELLENERIEKIMFDCASDRTLLFRQYGIMTRGIVDLAPAVEVLGYEKRGLDQVLYRALGKELQPKKKFQRYNWMKRPLDEDAVAYAVGDVTHLFDLKAALMKALGEKGLVEEYGLKNEEARSRPISAEAVPGIFKKNRFKKLPAASKDLFRKLFDTRDGYARKLDQPPNNVVSNEDLFRIATSRKATRELRFHRRIPGNVCRDIGRDFENILESRRSGPKKKD